jgi:hypothetical protein
MVQRESIVVRFDGSAKDGFPTGLIYRATNLPTFGEGIDANVRSTAGISERSIVESVLLPYR